MTQEEIIKQHMFNKIGTYSLDPDTGTVLMTSTVNTSGRVSITYAMFVDGVCKYLGKSISGYGRPLSYHRNDVMKRVRAGVEKSVLQEGKTVEIYAKKDNLSVLHEGLQLDLAEAVEAALIQKLRPKWNSWKGRRKS